jgi:hypothetical protein
VSFLEHKDLGKETKNWGALQKMGCPLPFFWNTPPQIAEEKLCEVIWPPVTLKNQSKSLRSYTYSLRVRGMLLGVRSLGMRSLSFLRSGHNIHHLFLEYSWK